MGIVLIVAGIIAVGLFVWFVGSYALDEWLRSRGVDRYPSEE